MHIHIAQLDRVSLLKLILGGLLVILMLLIEMRQIGPLKRLTADSMYSPDPVYGTIQLEADDEVKNLWIRRDRRRDRRSAQTELQHRAAERRASRVK